MTNSGYLPIRLFIFAFFLQNYFELNPPIFVLAVTTSGRCANCANVKRPLAITSTGLACSFRSRCIVHTAPRIATAACISGPHDRPTQPLYVEELSADPATAVFLYICCLLHPEPRFLLHPEFVFISDVQLQHEDFTASVFVCWNASCTGP